MALLFSAGFCATDCLSGEGRHMLHSFLHSLTNFGDGGIVGALVVLLAAFLATAGERKAALAVVAAAALVGGGIAAFKITLYSRCAQDALWLGLRSPSGHSAMAVVGYGLLTGAVASSLRGRMRYGLYVGALLWVGAIAASRVLLHYHSLGDVLAGLLLGTVATAAVWRHVMTGRRIEGRWALFAALAFVVLGAAYGHPLPAEALITKIAAYIRGHALMC